MKIAAMMRVRNEARWISEVLGSIHPITREILVLDDHSTDATPALCATAGATVIHSPFAEADKDEARDKNFLLEVVRATVAPDYVLAIDGDEIIEPAAAAKLPGMFNTDRAFYTMKVKYLWNDRQHVRMDGVYARFERASAFSLVRQPAGVKFRSTGYGANFHCGNVPAGLVGNAYSTGLALLHLGYMHQEDRLRKYAWYNQIDPNNGYEDRYRHMVVGDVFPAESKFLHGGPLKVWSIGNGPEAPK
jgi:glycosyltransferase involved in cell wall biosynthesis